MGRVGVSGAERRLFSRASGRDPMYVHIYRTSDFSI
jgi:hypothetical protein